MPQSRSDGEAKGFRQTAVDFAALVAVFCLVLLTIREFTGTSTANEPDLTEEHQEVADWSTLVATGHQWGNPAAPVIMVTFMDFECPACRDFALGTERIVRAKYPTTLRTVIRHLPLAYHRFAFHAAKAAECADEQGRFHEMYDALFAKQDSLGLKSMESSLGLKSMESRNECQGEYWGWGDLSQPPRASRVPRITEFEQCMSSSTVESRIHADIEAAESAGARGTPTVILNGLRLARPPPPAELERLIADALAKHQLTSGSVSSNSVRRQ